MGKELWGLCPEAQVSGPCEEILHSTRKDQDRLAVELLERLSLHIISDRKKHCFGTACEAPEVQTAASCVD